MTDGVEADLMGADLVGAGLVGADLVGAGLMGSGLVGADSIGELFQSAPPGGSPNPVGADSIGELYPPAPTRQKPILSASRSASLHYNEEGLRAFRASPSGPASCH
jgi:uncharacterized protein YjbI with pentapeptide repeats